MILKSHSSGAGLFSHLNFIVTHIELQGRDNLHIDWTSGLPYSDPGRGNLFEYLFEQLSTPKPGDPECTEWPHYNYTYNNAWKLYKSNDLWRFELNRCWTKLAIQPAILEEVQNFRSTWPSQVTGLHVRNLNIASECPGSICPTLEDYRRAVENIDGSIFLATDNNEAVEFFREILGDKLLTRKIARSKDMLTEFHLTTKQTFEDAKNCLIDALLLASCQQFIHSISNLATAVLYINPTLPHVPLTGHVSPSGDENSGETDWLIPRRVSEPTPSCSTIHVQHPGWSDWILLYRDGSFHRHDKPWEGGTWRTSEAKRIVLQWISWPAEEFELIKETYRQGSAKNLVNGINSICYSFKQSKIINLK